MRKTKEQILNEKRNEVEILQMPTKLKIESLNAISGIMILTKPIEVGFTEEQKWQSIWTDDELFNIKTKVLSIIRDL